MSRKRARSNAKKKRRENALAAQQHLSEVITDISMPMIARMNAAKHLVRTSSRNRLPLPNHNVIGFVEVAKLCLFQEIHQELESELVNESSLV